MNKGIAVDANVLIRDLKNSVDKLWAKCGSSSLNTVAYAEGERGAMQRAELRENLRRLYNLKTNLDWLLEECSSAPDFGRTEFQSSRPMDGPSRRIS